MNSKTERRRSAGKLAAVLSAALAAAALSTAAQAQGVSGSFADAACVALKKEFSAETTSGSVGEQLMVNGSRRILGGFMRGRSPICQLDDPIDLMVATADYIDRTALTAAQGLLVTAEVLEIDLNIAADVAALEASLNAGDVEDKLDKDRVKVSESIAAAGETVQKELKRRADLEDNNFMTPEKVLKLAEAQELISKASYFWAQSSVGVGSSTISMKRLEGSQRNAVFVNSLSGKEKRLPPSFFVEALPRASTMVKNLFDVVRLGGDLQRAANADTVQETKKIFRKSESRGKDRGKKESRELIKRIKNGEMHTIDEPVVVAAPLTVTPDSPAVAPQVAKRPCAPAKPREKKRSVGGFLKDLGDVLEDVGDTIGEEMGIEKSAAEDCEPAGSAR
ncbi:MAG: hypothetical protein AAGC56_01205 [Pseudomonadota bacterium]